MSPHDITDREKFLDLAVEAARQANILPPTPYRETWLKIAREWLALASGDGEGRENAQGDCRSLNQSS
jgi:hypothetical protein